MDLLQILLWSSYIIPAGLMLLTGIWLIIVSLLGSPAVYKKQNRTDGWHICVWGIVPIINMIIFYGVIVVFCLGFLMNIPDIIGSIKSRKNNKDGFN